MESLLSLLESILTKILDDPNSINIDEEEPLLWKRLLQGPNAIALGLYFALMGFGFTILKHLSDNGGSK